MQVIDALFPLSEDRGDSFPVTDDELDAPDGAVVDGYERQGDRWVRIPAVKQHSA